jgi:hypothetical protein
MKCARILRFSVAVAIFMSAGWLMRGYVTDDTYIHLRYAENLLQHGEFSFNPGHQTYGATSPLWIFGLVLLLKLGLAPGLAATALGALSGLLVLVLFDKILHRLSFREFWKFLLLVLVATDAWFLRWSWSGMETPLATALLLALLWPLFSGRDVGWGVTREPLWHRYLAWGLAAGLTGLVRPEFLLLGPLALPLLLWFEYFRAGGIGGREARHRARPQQPMLAAAVGWLLAVGPWLAYAWFTFGRIVPGTASAKSTAVSLAPDLVLRHLWQAIKVLAATQGVLWIGLLLLIGLVWWRNSASAKDGPWYRNDTEDQTGAQGSIGAGPWSVWGPVAVVGIAVVWTVALLGGYALRQVWIISRYVSPLDPVLMLAMGLVAEWLLRGTAIDLRTLWIGRRIILGAIGLTIAVNIWLFTTQVLPHARQFPTGVRECYLDLGYWLRDNTPPGTVIAALDIGALGFGSERIVLDLMGLVSPEVLDLGRQMGFADMVESGAWLKLGAEGQRPGYLVDRSEGEPRWTGRTVHGVRFELLQTCLLPGVGLREKQPWTVALYRLVSTETGVRSPAGG